MIFFPYSTLSLVEFGFIYSDMVKNPTSTVNPLQNTCKITAINMEDISVSQRLTTVTDISSLKP
jgi:hypothetical protein